MESEAVVMTPSLFLWGILTIRGNFVPLSGKGRPTKMRKPAVSQEKVFTNIRK